MPSKCVILISNSRDFATDYVVAELLARGVKYVRLDTDLLHEDSISLNPIVPTLDVRTPQGFFHIESHDATGILFRAPTHLSESGADRYAPEEQLSRHQWAAFTRAMIVFEEVVWINHPVPTFAAECKPYQLQMANKLGWDVMPTLITNDVPSTVWEASGADLAIKALDTFYIQLNNEDVFFYTYVISRLNLSYESQRFMPVILQKFAASKLDIRVTVVRDQCFAVSIHQKGQGILGDWRIQKDTVEYQMYDLPLDIELRCVALVRSLGLVYGALDLLYVDDRYFFLEVNPTGEWAWLTERLGLPIAVLLADALCSGRSVI